MTNARAATEAPDYGLDAPGVIRNLFLAAGACYAIWGTAALGLWSGTIGGGGVRFSLGPSAIWSGIGCTLMGFWMLWDSKIGKVRDRERLLDQLTWSGTERVLDVGCGRGLMLIAAAKRLTTGTATGIDIWQAEDLSGNKPEATLQNARLEGVANRVDVKTADMRQIPFPDATFDRIVSCAAIHNIYSSEDRAQAIREIARVLKPGGSALIDDIRHHIEYAATFEQNGCEVRTTSSRIATIFFAVVTVGSLRPATLLVQKAA